MDISRIIRDFQCVPARLRRMFFSFAVAHVSGVVLLTIFFLLISAGVNRNLTFAQTKAVNFCISCHQETWNDAKTSAHFQHGVYCQHCHGGDASQPDQKLAKAAGTGYLGIPDKKQIVSICGDCHNNIEQMNFYGIRTDQLALYKTSMHGKKLFKDGDTHVAVCSDCHGYHEIGSVRDSNSPIYPLNIPKTCNKCHGNKTLMDSYGLPSDTFELYKNSVHGKALFGKKDISVAQCVSCHGDHGAVPPGVKSIGVVCGKCHVNEQKYFMESVHADLAGEKKFSGCVSCHGNHGVQHITSNYYKEACVKCHNKTSDAVKEGKKIFQLLTGSEARVATAENLVKQAGIKGVFVQDEVALLNEARTSMIEMGPLQHALSVEKISELYKKVSELTAEVTASVQKKQHALKWRKLFLIPFWIFILIIVWALWTQYKRFKSGK